MAINSDNLFTEGFRGTVGGNMTFRRTKSGKVIVSKKAKASELPPTADQVSRRLRFKRGLTYAANALKDLVRKALYGSKVQGDQSAFNVALKDYCKSPEVLSINTSGYHGQIGDRIVIEATDDFRVESVQVAVYTMDNELVEQGAAILDADGDGVKWTYTTTEDHIALEGSTIKAIAKDLPGHEGSLEVTL